MIREFFEDMSIASIIIVIFILGIGFIFVDGLASKPESFSGEVIDKHYEAERNSIGTGYGVTSSGKGGVITTSEHESEKFLLMVKTESGEAVTVECEPEIYYQKAIGQMIDCISYNGYFTGWTWSLKGAH